MPVEVSDPAIFARHLVNVAVVTAALCLPPVTRATGMAPTTIIAIVLVNVLWTASVMFIIRPSARSAVRFHLALAGSAVINTAIVVAFPVLGSDPETPLWMLPVMYACFNASFQEIDPSIGILLIHVVTPLLAIPLLLSRGANASWSFAAPVLCSVISAVGYNYLAQVSAGFREHRRQSEAALAALRAKLDEDDRARLVRELHDGLGSSLTFVGLYGDLIERHVDRPDQLRAIAGMVRDAARDGGVELAALIGAVMPEGTTLDGVVAAIEQHGQRAASSAGTAIDVRVLRGGGMALDGSVRLALVRVFQESLHNALRHGSVKNLRVDVAVDAGEVSIDIVDDGIGFEPTQAAAGLGLAGMRARAVELGGTFTLTASLGAGAHIRVTLPRSTAATT